MRLYCNEFMRRRKIRMFCFLPYRFKNLIVWLETIDIIQNKEGEKWKTIAVNLSGGDWHEIS